MLPPIRRTGFFTTAVLLCGLFPILPQLVADELVGAEPTETSGESLDLAARSSGLRGKKAWNFNDVLRRRDAPHPSVVRIVVPDGPVMAFGTGTLIDVRDQCGLVITNWHVVRDSTGVIEVIFPDGFRSRGRALKVDPDWDLAAVVIWRPPAEPVTLADQPPRPGDALTIHGYGQGQYRVASGRCTQYYAPRPDFPQEMVELNVEARQGDSGGPIFNTNGELAGVLFGAGQGTTIGSFGGRVETFLASLAPDIGRAEKELIAEANPQPMSPKRKVTSPILGGTPSEKAIAKRSDTENVYARRSPQQGWSESPWTSATRQKKPASPGPATVAVSPSPESGTQQLADQSRIRLLENVKSFLAVVGFLAICIQVVRLVS